MAVYQFFLFYQKLKKFHNFFNNNTPSSNQQLSKITLNPSQGYAYPSKNIISFLSWFMHATEIYISQGHFGQNTFDKQLCSIMTHWISSMQI